MSFCSFASAEARDHLDVDGELREALLERLEMLEAEHGGGREHRNLLAVLHGLERRAHGHFGFAVAHVAAQQPVHRRRRFHVVFDGADGRCLIVGLVVIECVFELALEFVVLGECGALRGVALGVELEQLRGHVLHGLAHARLGFGPLLRAEPVEHRRGSGVGGAIFLDQIEARERNVELGALGEFQNHELDREAVLRDLFQALILRDAVLHVHHVVADAEIAKVGDKGRGLRSFGLGPRRYVGLVGEVVGAEDDQVCFGKADARCQRRAHDDRHAQIAGQISWLRRAGFRRGVERGCPAGRESRSRAEPSPGVRRRPGARRRARSASPLPSGSSVAR